MTPYTNDQEEVRQYLLGHLSEEVQRRIEERLLTEDSFLEEMLVAEEELIDDYINGELVDDVRLRFEQHFISTPERQQSLRFAMALSRYTANSAETAASESAKAQVSMPPSNPTWAERFRVFWNSQGWALRSAISFGVIAILAGAIWLAVFRSSSPRTFTPLILTASISDNRTEGPTIRKVQTPLKDDALKISLILPERLPQAIRYRVELMNEEGETRPLSIVEEDARSVSVVIPASQLKRGEYALSLVTIGADGREQPVNGNYFFIVE